MQAECPVMTQGLLTETAWCLYLSAKYLQCWDIEEQRRLIGRLRSHPLNVSGGQTERCRECIGISFRTHCFVTALNSNGSVKCMPMKAFYYWPLVVRTLNSSHTKHDQAEKYNASDSVWYGGPKGTWRWEKSMRWDEKQ